MTSPPSSRRETAVFEAYIRRWRKKLCDKDSGAGRRGWEGGGCIEIRGGGGWLDESFRFRDGGKRGLHIQLRSSV